jgi:vacuolar protein sorting-associated protein 1
MGLMYTFYPGLIQNETMDAIELVRRLVECNIQGDSTLILVTIPASGSSYAQFNIIVR